MLRAAPPWAFAPPGAPKPPAPATITESPFLISATLAPVFLLTVVEPSILTVVEPFWPLTVIESALTAVTV